MAMKFKPQWEIYCLARHSGLEQVDAYRQAFPEARKSSDRQTKKYAWRLEQKVVIQQRLEELKASTAAVVIEKTANHHARIVLELARLAFSNIEDVVTWHGNLVEDRDERVDGSDVVVKHIYNNNVGLVDHERVHVDAKAAIKSIKQGANGQVSVEMHPKMPALQLLAEIYGLTGARNGPQGVPGVGSVGGGDQRVIDGPPAETYDEWIARRGREVGAAARATNGRDPGEEH